MPTWTYGKFVWRELMTSDVPGALRFYGELFGWKSKRVDMPNGPYHLLLQGEQQVGGLMGMPPDADLPPWWMGYVSVPDVDAALEQARARGGQVVWGPEDVPEVGRMGTLVDPQGATVSVMRAAPGDPALTQTPSASEFCWEELAAADVPAAKAFYGAVLGWKVFAGPSAAYSMLGMGERSTELAASLRTVAVGELPAWRSFVLVGDLPSVRERALRLGGKILHAEVEVPGIGTYATLVDPQGATLNAFKAAM